MIEPLAPSSYYANTGVKQFFVPNTTVSENSENLTYKIQLIICICN